MKGGHTGNDAERPPRTGSDSCHPTAVEASRAVRVAQQCDPAQLHDDHCGCLLHPYYVIRRVPILGAVEEWPKTAAAAAADADAVGVAAAAAAAAAPSATLRQA